MDEFKNEQANQASHNNEETKHNGRTMKQVLFKFFGLAIEFQPISNMIYCLLLVCELIQFGYYLSIDVGLQFAFISDSASSYSISEIFKYPNYAVLIMESGNKYAVDVYAAILLVCLLQVILAVYLAETKCQNGSSLL